MLLVGNDSREDRSQDQLTKLGTETAEGLLTDTIMLARLNPRRDGAAIISFPRDLLVTRCDGSRGRINAAYEVREQTGTGGPACLVEIVRDLTGLEVDNYVEVDFAGFIDVVNSLGGATLHLDQPLKDRYAGLDLPAGCVSLDGTEALSFVRARHLDSDFGRIARQQGFMRELVEEVMSADTLLDVGQLPSLLQSTTDAVEVDSELSLAQMRRLAHSLRDASPDGLTTRTVPAVPRRIDGAAYVVAQEQPADRLFSAFANGRLTVGDTTSQPGDDGTATDTPEGGGGSASADAPGNESDEPDYAGAQSPATQQCS